jgi:hypothetical protein
VSGPSSPPWTLGQRLAFRFLFLFYVHFALTRAPFARIPGVLPWLQRYALLWSPWVERLGGLLGFEPPLSLAEAGARPSLYGWVLLLGHLSLAALGALVWTLFGRRRDPHARLQAWFHWLQRILVSGALINYGMIKLVPTQMIAPPPPGVLLFRVGDLEANHLLWWFVGASPTFESITGLAELAAGLLLLFPRTTLLGALLATADMATVFALNLGYDVPVKVYSFHLLLLSILLVLPHRRRLANLFLLNRKVEPAAETPLFRNPSLHRAAQLAVVALGIFFVTESVQTTRERYAKLYPPRSPFYSAWSVEGFAIEGREVPLHTDPGRWRWVTFGKPKGMAVERMDGSPLGFEAEIDPARKTFVLRAVAAKGGAPASPSSVSPNLSRPEVGNFAYRRPDGNSLVLEGQLEGRRAVIRLEKMALVKRR